MTQIVVTCGARSLVLIGPDVGGATQVGALEVHEGAHVLAKLTLGAAVAAPLILTQAAAVDPADRVFKSAPTGDIELAAREALRRALSRIALTVSAGAGAFFGVEQLPDAANVTAWVGLDIRALLDDPAAGAGDVLLSAGMTASVAVTGAGARQLAYSFTARISAAGAADLVAGFDLPGLTFEAPRLAWNLSFAALDLPPLDKLLRLDLPVPAMLGGAPPIRVQWQDAAHTLHLRLDVAAGVLAVTTSQPGDGTLQVQTSTGWTDVITLAAVGLQIGAGSGVSLAGSLTSIALGSPPTATLPEGPFGGGGVSPVIVRLRGARVSLSAQGAYQLAAGTGQLALVATLSVDALELRATEDPSLVLALALAYEIRCVMAPAGVAVTPRLASLSVVEPWPVALVGQALQTVAGAVEDLIRILALARLPTTGAPTYSAPLLDHLIKMLESVMRWIARQAGAVGQALASIAEGVFDLLARVLAALRDAALRDVAMDYVAIEVRLDARTLQLRQVLVTPAHKAVPTSAFHAEGAGLTLDLPIAWNPALLIELTPVRRAAFVVQTAGAAATLSTDLWMKRSGEPADAVRDQDPQSGGRPATPLIQLTAKPQTSAVATSLLGLITLENGQARFFREIGVADSQTIPVAASDNRNLSLVAGEAEWTDLDIAHTFDVGVKVSPDAVERLLPFFQSPNGGGGGGLLDSLGAYVTIKPSASSPTIQNRAVSLPVSVTLHIGGMDAATDLGLGLSLDTLLVSISGGDEIVVSGGPVEHQLLGLDAVVIPKATPADPSKYPQFRLSFSGGDVRLTLHEDAELQLSYGAIASAGKGLKFVVETFGVSRDGLDLSAAVDTSEPVRLGGLDVPFRFDSGSLNVKRGRLQSFAIRGHGALPPDLVGDARATIELAMGRSPAADLIVTGGKAELDKVGDPLVCHATRFTFSIDALGLEFVDYGKDGGYQFYFTLTGSAQFTPGDGEFTDGLLKYLSGLKIEFHNAPLTGDGRKLAESISFLIPIEPRRRTNLFNVFGFELRGIGFQPQSPDFDGDPALLLSGQISFTPSSDVVSAKFDVHRMAFARPAKGHSLPRVRVDGLTVALALGGTATVEGTAYAVDKTLPTLFDPGVLPKGVTASGFLASGRLSVKGWASMSAAMGFLEIPDGSEPRHAFFLYVKENELSTEIPTPIGTLYQREVGFGFGFRYTLAFAAADSVTSVKDLIKVLDDISAYQGDLDSLRSWWPEPKGNRLTLALNSLFTISSVSSETDYDADGEKDLPNPVIFDVTAALRSDLTFFLAARAWLSVNYADWHDSLVEDAWRSQPLLRGYIYLSVPRKEFLGRLVADPQGYVGEHPPLPGVLKSALKSVRWSSTLYIRPGLFHQEFGWPYELGFNLGSDAGDFYVECRGGMVLRIEDASILNGWAFKAKGFARFGGRIGGRSLGASALARADFSIEAKLIAYVARQNISESLFYGYFGLDVSVVFSIRVWLSFSIFGGEITLEAGFSQSLSISVALELAASPGALAGRGAASIGVGAFGRSLRLSVSFGFNEDMLVTARARVERFLSLGLTASVPDPNSGLAPQPAKPLGPAAANTDATVAAAAQKRALAQTPLPLKTPLVAKGRPIRSADFWAMLAPAPGRSDAFVMTLLPRDHTGAASVSDIQDKGAFFAPPPAAGTTLAQTLRGLTGLRPVTLRRVGPTGVPDIRPFATDTPIDIASDWTAALAVKNAHTLHLSDYVADCFVVGPNNSLSEPEALPVRAAHCHLPDDPDARAAALNDAGSDVLSLGVEYAKALELDERRSALIAELGQDLPRLASTVFWPDNDTPPTLAARVNPAFEVRDFGLTFLVTQDELEKLFDFTAEGVPPLGYFDIQLSDPATGQVSGGDVRLFNPPKRMFVVAQPQLSQPVARPTPQGISLDWDLRPRWPQSSSSTGLTTLWDDPEFHLKHYRIERTLTTATSVLADVPPRRATTKAGAPVKLDVNGDGADAELAWRRLRPRAQYVDDLADLPAALRSALLDGAAAADKWNVGVLAGHDYIQLLYSVTPVDAAGTEGAPGVLVCQISRPQPAGQALKRATATVQYAEIGAANPDIRLGFVDPSFEETRDGRPRAGADPGASRQYRLKVRAERAPPAGLFGSDAVTDARTRPTPDDFDQFYPGLDTIFALTLQRQAGSTWPPEDDAGRAEFPLQDALSGPFSYVLTGTGGKRADLLAAMGVANKAAADGPVPIRLAVAPQHGPWTPVDLMLVIGAAPLTSVSPLTPPVRLAGDPQPIAMPLDVFEHPVRVTPVPHDFQDLAGDSGRLMLVHPQPRADLVSLLLQAGVAVYAPGGQPSNQLTLLNDPKRRVATRIRWNVVPTNCGPNRRPFLTAGFDVFQLDVHSLPMDWSGLTKADQQAQVRRLARPVARVQLTAEQLVRLDPPEIPDFAKLEAFYPSETLRLTCAGPGQARAPWFSAAESLVLFPERPMRRSLCLAPDESLITSLFGNVAPTSLSLSLSGWAGDTAPRAPAIAEPLPSELSANTTPALLTVTLHDAGNPNTTLTPRHVRRVLRSLVGPAAPATVGKPPPVLTMIARSPSGDLIATADFTVDLAQDLHPVLADTIDILRYSVDGGPAGPGRFGLGAEATSAYRRYEPILEPLPKTQSTSVLGWFAEAPPARDPYGWAALRTLGLGVGLRVYDTGAGDYELSGALLARLADALALAQGRYPGVDLGAPFVDLLYRDGGLSELASFDGAAPALTAEIVADVVDGRPLATVQISLRPVAAGLAGQAGHAAYWRVETNAPDVRIEPPKNGIVEVIDLGDPKGDRPGAPLSLDPQAPLLEAKPSAATTTINRTGHKSLILRVLTISGTPSPPRVGRGDIPATAAPLPGCLTEGVSPDAFGRFDPLTPGQLAILAGTPQTAAGLALARLQAWVSPRFPDPWPVDSATGLQPAGFASQLRDWQSRFIDFGPGAVLQASRPAMFSLAALERTEPHRVAAGADGTVDVLLLHDDRYDRLRRFAVQPYGRYAQLDAARPLPNAPPPRELQIQNAPSTGKSPFVDVTTPRSAPLKPPVILSARRRDQISLQHAPTSPGTELELVVARHPEQILVESNRVVEGALGFEHTAVGFWRELPAAKWIDGLRWFAPTAPFGSGARLTPALSFPEATPFGEVTDAIPDGWRGVDIYRMEGLPFFYRTHAVAFSAAGVVVSPVATATFEEGSYVLRAPWAAGHPSGDPLDPPSWTIDSHPSDPTAPVIVTLTAPLVRYLDEADDAQWAAWLPAAGATPNDVAKAPAVFQMPDPAVRYELHLETRDANGMAVISDSREIDLAAEDPPADGGPSVFLVRAVGPRLAAADGGRASITGVTRPSGWQAWSTAAKLRVRGGAPVKPPPVWLAPTAPATIFSDPRFVLPAAAFAPVPTAAAPPWATWAPHTAASLVVLRPTTPALWAGLPAAVATARGALAAYLTDVFAAQAMDQALSRIANVSSQADWSSTLPGNPAQFNTPIADFPAGLPGRVWTGSIQLQTGAWTWPAFVAALDPTPSAGEAARSTLATALVATGVPNVAAALSGPLTDSLRRLVQAWALWRDLSGWGLSPAQTVAATPPVAAPPPTSQSVAAVTAALATPALVAAAAAVVVTRLPIGIDLPRTVRLAGANRDPVALSTLRAALEGRLGSAAALQMLGAFEQGNGSTTLVLRLPGVCAADTKVHAALATLANAGAVQIDDPDCLTIWRPPSSAERGAARDAFVRSSPLESLFLSAADDQLFGPGRRPALRLLRGLAAPPAPTTVKEG